MMTREEKKTTLRRCLYCIGGLQPTESDYELRGLADKVTQMLQELEAEKPLAVVEAYINKYDKEHPFEETTEALVLTELYTTNEGWEGGALPVTVAIYAREEAAPS